MNKLKIIIAGPGAGKTYNLKGEVISCLPNLERNRFCTIITYTNVATEELRQRISSEILIPPNVFIGTIHSFLIRFIIEPFEHLIPIEKNYIENVSSNYRVENKNTKKTNAANLVKNGITTNKMVIEYAKNILKKFPTIANVLGNRLQYIFIDEYQDSGIYIHQIFQKILSVDNSIIKIIGDPLQSISNLTYLHSPIIEKSKLQPKSFTETPMMLYESKFRNGIDVVLKDNYRSSAHIVNLINEYILNCKQKQVSVHGDNGIPVYFIEKTKFSEIFNIYTQLKIKHNIDNIHNNLKKSKKNLFKDLFLTGDWIDIENSEKPKLKNMYKVLNGKSVRLEKGNYWISSVLQEVSLCILAVTGVKKKDFIKSTHDEMEYRKFCFEMVRCLKLRDFNDYEHCIEFIRKQFQEKFNIINNEREEVNVRKSLFELSNNKLIIHSSYHESYFSSIHNAKGSEATVVIVIAYTKKELEKWLNFQEANNNLDDDYRLGYVAIGRARSMLCISCLEEISTEMKKKLESLNIIFIQKVK